MINSVAPEWLSKVWIPRSQLHPWREAEFSEPGRKNTGAFIYFPSLFQSAMRFEHFHHVVYSWSQSPRLWGLREGRMVSAKTIFRL